MKKIITLARMEEVGLRETGKFHRPDGVNWVPELERYSIPRACVWSSDMTDLERGEKFAREKGFAVLVLNDTSDVLEKAKAIISGKMTMPA